MTTMTKEEFDSKFSALFRRELTDEQLPLVLAGVYRRYMDRLGEAGANRVFAVMAEGLSKPTGK